MDNPTRMLVQLYLMKSSSLMLVLSSFYVVSEEGDEEPVDGVPGTQLRCLGISPDRSIDHTYQTCLVLRVVVK